MTAGYATLKSVITQISKYGEKDPPIIALLKNYNVVDNALQKI